MFFAHCAVVQCFPGALQALCDGDRSDHLDLWSSFLRLRRWDLGTSGPTRRVISSNPHPRRPCRTTQVMPVPGFL